MCTHQPTCPTADRPDREAARVVAAHPEQGWSRLCNGTIVFDDTGELLPGGEVVPPRRPVLALIPTQPQSVEVAVAA
ncbi:DUF5999 family protein [Streptomyces sp. NPDC050418]|uniref:DUF5999 family protein n=1 Tax=Streptomyces sp. NPDC050418 TaxID=3365612 RepID=UPI003791EB48